MNRLTYKNKKGEWSIKNKYPDGIVLVCAPDGGYYTGTPIDRLAEIEDKLESGQFVDTTPYIVEIKNEIPFKYKVIKPTVHRRNVEMCDSRESAERCIAKLAETANHVTVNREMDTTPCLTCDTIDVRCKDCLENRPKSPTHGSNARPPQRGLEIGIHIENLKSIIRKETLEEVFTDMYKLVEAEEKHCDITISGADIKTIAKRYGVEVRR